MEQQSTLKKIILFPVVLAGALLTLVSFASLAYNTGYWYFQILNFPRLQTLILLVFFLVFFLLLSKVQSVLQWVFVGAMTASIMIQAYILFPYFPLATQSIKSADKREIKADAVFSIMLTNVYMHNRQSKKLMQLINEYKPSIFIALEVNDWWANQLDMPDNYYQYSVKYPTENTYGMILYSKLPLQSTETHFLNHDSVPSFYTTVSLPNGKQFRLVAIHPVAPKPSPHPDNVNEEDMALEKAGHIVKTYELPTIVAGDFNDVSWSHNSNHFEEISGLYDIRNGRGLYNTFNAKSYIMRWPLDYVYTSKQFKVIEVERLDQIGSDHFPFYVKLVLP